MIERQKARGVSIQLSSGRYIWHYMTDEAIDELVALVKQTEVVSIANPEDDSYSLIWTKHIIHLDIGVMQTVPDHCGITTVDLVGDAE